MSSKTKELKRIKKYCKLAAINFEQASKSDDPRLIWAILRNISETIHGYESAAKELWCNE
jgi:hypothetical protein